MTVAYRPSKPRLPAKLPPGPRSAIPGKVFRELRRSTLDFMTRLAKDYGDIASFRTLGIQYIVVNSPDLAREILMGPPEVYWKGPALRNSKGILGEGLLTAEESEHRRQRRMMQGPFHAKHVEHYSGAIVESTREVMASWNQRLRDPAAQTIDIRPEMMGLTLVISGRALFGTLLADDVRIVHRCMDDLMNNYRRAIVPWGKLLNHLPIPSTLKLGRARDALFGLVERMIAEKRAAIAAGGPAASTTRPDLLSMMIAVTDDAEIPSAHAKGRLTDTQLRDQCLTILTASHETTANAMTFTLHLLAKHPQEQQLLREEIAAAIKGRDWTPDLLDHLPRTRWILSESMRLYPPAWTLGRQNQIPVTLGGFNLPAKCTILIPQWTLHRNPRYWDRPLEFLPERWRDPKHPRFAYIPFSTGHRNCIGESFAWLEMILALAMLVRAYEFTPADNREMTLTPAITLRPREAVLLNLRAIHPA